MKVTSTPAAVGMVTTRPSSSASALIANAQVQVEAQTSSPVVVDTYDANAAARSDSTPTNAELDTNRSTSNNPFDDLPRDEEEKPCLASAIGTETALDANADQLARMNAAMRGLLARDSSFPQRTTEGMLLVTHDAQTATSNHSADIKALSDQVTRLLANQTTSKETMAAWRRLLDNNRNVSAYAQRVLRESYVQSTLTMRDIADRLKQANDLRKKIRDELNKARKTQSAWTTESKGDAQWFSATPYAVMQVNGDASDLEPDVYDKKELQERIDALSSRSASTNTDAAALQIQQFIDQLNGDSKLTDLQKRQLEAIVRGDDDSAKDRMTEITAAMKGMNRKDIQTYIEPILDNLEAGNTDEDAIRKLFSEMDPAQMAQVISDGYTASKFGFGHDDSVAFREITDKALYEVAQRLGVDLQASPKKRDDSENTTDQVTEEGAKRLLTAIMSAAQEANTRNQHSSNDAESSDGSKIGAQRMVDTTGGLEAYLKGMEDQLNSVGDDAQLLNVDLQDQLQKAQLVMQMMSNLLKTDHDTAMAVVRNLNT